MLYFPSGTGSLTICLKDTDQINLEGYIALLNHCQKGYTKYARIQTTEHTRGTVQGYLKMKEKLTLVGRQKQTTEVSAWRKEVSILSDNTWYSFCFIDVKPFFISNILSDVGQVSFAAAALGNAVSVHYTSASMYACKHFGEEFSTEAVFMA